MFFPGWVFLDGSFQDVFSGEFFPEHFFFWQILSKMFCFREFF